MTSVMWFRRDLRLSDNPALLSAVAASGADNAPEHDRSAGHDAGHDADHDADRGVVPLFVLDPALSRSAGLPRRAYLAASLTDLGSRIGGLQLRRGDPVQEVVAVARAASARTVHVTEDFGPRGRRRDRAVEAARATATTSWTGSPRRS